MLLNVCVILYMYPVSEYITEIILFFFFLPLRTLCFSRFPFICLFLTLSSMSEVFLRGLLILAVCSYLKTVPQKAVQKP